jgi:DNA phosphorothioation-dependent restriction protein DptG
MKLEQQARAYRMLNEIQAMGLDLSHPFDTTLYNILGAAQTLMASRTYNGGTPIAEPTSWALESDRASKGERGPSAT